MEIGSDYNLNIKSNSKKLFYASGRIAITNILYKVIQNKESCLIPNYLCESIYNCFDNFDFYKINNNFEIDIKYLTSIIKKNKYKLIFIINYLGYVDKNIELITSICKKNNIVIIEDFTHNIYTETFYGDVSLCSYRKSLPTPFGAVVIDHNNILNIDNKKTINFTYIFLVFLKSIGMFLKNYFSIKWIWRPILLFCEENIDRIDYSDFDYLNNLFYKYYYDKDDKYIRINNFRYLHKNLKTNTLDKFSNTYFTFPILFNSKVERDEIRKILSKNKIYCPIYWPLYFDKDNECNHYITNHILCIPIDQRYNIDNMKHIVQILNKCISTYIISL